MRAPLTDDCLDGDTLDRRDLPNCDGDCSSTLAGDVLVQCFLSSTLTATLPSADCLDGDTLDRFSLVASLDGDVLVRFFLSSNSTLASLCAVFALLRLSRRVLPSILSSC